MREQKQTHKNPCVIGTVHSQFKAVSPAGSQQVLIQYSFYNVLKYCKALGCRKSGFSIFFSTRQAFYSIHCSPGLFFQTSILKTQSRTLLTAHRSKLPYYVTYPYMVRSFQHFCFTFQFDLNRGLGVIFSRHSPRNQTACTSSTVTAVFKSF